MVGQAFGDFLNAGYAFQVFLSCWRTCQTYKWIKEQINEGTNTLEA